MTRIRYEIARDKQKLNIDVEPSGEGKYAVTLDGDGSHLMLDLQQVGPREYHVLDGDRSLGFLVEGDLPRLVVYQQGEPSLVELLDERHAARQAATGSGASRMADGTLAITAPMPGRVVKRLVGEGEQVTPGQGVIVVEAMKMENELRAQAEGTVKEFKVNEGDNVEAGECLVLIE